MARVEIMGSRVLLTGASSGIGREMAKEFTARGASLAISARRRPLLDDVADEIAGRGHDRPAVIEADLSQRGQAAALAGEAEAALGGIDILVNNAGGGVGGAQWAVGDSDPGREAFEINVWSPAALIQALVPAMRERRRGAVVNVTSLAQISTWPGFGTYAATKAALGVMTETLRMELIDSPVHVLESIPGPVNTAVQAETRLIPGIERMLDRMSLGDPAVMARVTVQALERGKDRVIYPGIGRFVYTLPTVVRRDIRRRVAQTVREIDAGTREAMMSLVVRSGSMGDPMAREAREAWEEAQAARS